MRARERFSCAVGNVFNDLYSQLLFSFLIIFLMKIVELSASQAGMMVLIAQISDASISLISGYLGDNVNVPFLSNKIGRRKSWHLVATILMAIGVPLLFNKCFLCDGRDQSWIPLVYFGFFSALTGGCFSIVEINHLAFVTNAADKASELTELTVLRTMFSFLSGIYVYTIAWALLGQDNGDNLGHDNLTDFVYLSWITTGTGVLFANIFYIGRKELKNRERKSSTWMDLEHGGTLFMGVSELGNQDSRKTHLTHSNVHMRATSWNEKTDQEDEKQTKRSLLQKFVDVIFLDEEDEMKKSTQGDPHKGDTKLQMVSLGIKEDEQSDDTRKEMVLGLQKLDCDRKKSLLMRVIDGLLSRSDYSQQEEISTDSFEDHAAVDTVNDENITGENCWRQEWSQDIQREDNRDNSDEVDSVDTEKEIDEEEKPTSVSAKCKQRRSGTVTITSHGKPGLPNFGFEHERGEEIEEECSSDTSGLPRQKKKRRPKSMKHWLRDPNLYKVAIVYTCSRLVQGTVYTYLPLFLIERLQFAKAAIAYFPLVLLISASLSSLFCEKLNKNIGSKWSYLLAASLVIGGAIWSYFQTPSTQQVTYAPVILIGFGMSVMYVMALAFITELIGENKETSGAVISIITVIGRLTSGGLVISIQGFYPEKGFDTNEAISDYVQHVFVMGPGVLTLVGFLLVLFFQSSVLPCKTKAQDKDTEAEEQEDQSPSAFVVSQFLSKHTATSTISQGVNQNATIAIMHEDTKL